MNSSLDSARRSSTCLRTVLGAAALSCLLAACGQRGPLTLPVRPAPLATTPAPARPANTPLAPAAPPAPVSPPPATQ